MPAPNKPNWLGSLFTGELNTNQLNLSGNNPFEPALQAARNEWMRRLNANTLEGSAFDRVVDLQDKAQEWDAMQQGAIPPGAIRVPRGILPALNSNETPSWLRSMNAYEAQQQSVNPNLNQKFQDLLNLTREGIKKTGTFFADTVAPWRHNVPEKMEATLETPDFAEHLRQRTLFGGIPVEGPSKWLLDPRRTPTAPPSAYGQVVLPTGSESVFKYQTGQPKSFYENEINMAARTAELGLGPQVHAATFKGIGPGEYQAIFKTEKIPHVSSGEMTLDEMRYRDLEASKLTEDLFRAGIRNVDAHAGNVVIDKRTGKPMQLDSGLAIEYNPFDKDHLSRRLLNIESGLYGANLKDVARDTGEIGRAMIDEISKNPSPELYADIENFFNRSGNILKNQKIDLPRFNQLQPIIDPTKARAGFRSGLRFGAADFIPSPEAIRDLYAGKPLDAIKKTGFEALSGVPLAVGVGTAVAAAPALAPIAAGAGGAAVLARASAAANEVVRQQTGEDILSKTRQFLGTRPRTGVADTPRVGVQPLTATILPMTPAQRQEHFRQQQENELQKRFRLAGQRFNPARGEFGLSEMFFGR